jgi:hypothetical protein
MFGLPYEPAKIHYEQLQVGLSKKCDLGQGSEWIYAKYTRNDAVFYVVMGFSPDQESDSLGNVIRVQGEKCEGDAALNVFGGFVPANGYSPSDATSPVPGRGAPLVPEDKQGNFHYMLRTANEEAVLRGLARDAIGRAEQAWGAKAFRAKICPYDKSFDRHAPVLGDEYGKYCKGA